MIKTILSIAIIAVVFSGCVGTVIATNSVKDSKASTVLNAKCENDLNKTKENINKAVIKNKK
jgi:PBP1b-binding outer membrane lipoprotein LpoB